MHQTHLIQQNTLKHKPFSSRKYGENFNNWTSDEEVLIILKGDQCCMLTIPTGLIKLKEFFNIKIVSFQLLLLLA